MTPSVQAVLAEAVAKGCKVLYPSQILTPDCDSGDLRYFAEIINMATGGTYKRILSLSNEEVVDLVLPTDEDTREALVSELDHYDTDAFMVIEAPPDYPFEDETHEHNSLTICFWTDEDPYPGKPGVPLTEVATLETNTVHIPVDTTTAVGKTFAESMAKINEKHTDAFKKLADS